MYSLTDDNDFTDSAWKTDWSTPKYTVAVAAEAAGGTGSSVSVTGAGARVGGGATEAVVAVLSSALSFRLNRGASKAMAAIATRAGTSQRQVDERAAAAGAA